MDPNIAISEIMTHNLVTVVPHDSLAKVNTIFLEYNFHHIPVVDKGNRLVGMITKEDLLRLTSVRPEFSDKAFDKIAVKDIMTSNLVTLEAEDTVGLAADIFLANEFHAIPVLEEERLTGIITTYDLIKYAYKTPFNAPMEEGQFSLDEMNPWYMHVNKLLVRQVMTPQVITVMRTDTMEQVSNLFQKHNIHHIPVLDHDNKLIGLVSKSDYLQMLHGKTLFRIPNLDQYNQVIMKTTLVKDIMVEDVVAIDPDRPIAEAIHLFRKNLFRALPVVTEGKLIGILTPYDLMSDHPAPK